MSFPLNSAQMYAHIEFFKKIHPLGNAYNIATSASIDIFHTIKKQNAEYSALLIIYRGASK